MFSSGTGEFIDGIDVAVADGIVVESAVHTKRRIRIDLEEEKRSKICPGFIDSHLHLNLL